MKRKGKQYTIRSIPEREDARLRETAAQYGSSLNTAAVAALARGLDLDAEPVVHHDLDDLAGSWVQDPEFDKAMEAMDRVDAELWS